MKKDNFKEFEFHTDIYTDIVATQTQLHVVGAIGDKNNEDFMLELTLRLLALNDCLKDTSKN